MARRLKSGSRRRRLWFEALEDRAVPAGQVTAQLLLDGTLRITGDALANQIAVRTVEAVGGDLWVTGIGTAVNGGAQAEFNSAQVSRIVINLGAGNDTANLSDLAVGGGITVVDDLGNDTYTAAALNIPTSALNISTGVGADNVVVDASFLGVLLVDTGAGSDDVSLGQLQPLRVNLAQIVTGSGEDEVQIENAIFNGLLVDTGENDDILRLVGVETNNLAANTGAGNDVIDLEDVTSTGTLAVSAGSGNDVVFATDVVAVGLGVIDGGTGTDVLVQGGVNSFLALNFEVVI